MQAGNYLIRAKFYFPLYALLEIRHLLSEKLYTNNGDLSNEIEKFTETKLMISN